MSFRPSLCEKCVTHKKRLYTLLPASATDIVFYYPLADRLLWSVSKIWKGIA